MGLGAIVGGALQGVGRGLEMQETERALERRDRRLAEARMAEQAAGAQQALEQVTLSNTMAGQREAAGDQRRLDSEITLKGIDFENEATLGAASAQSQAANAEAERQHEIAKLAIQNGYDREEAERQYGYDVELARLEAQLGQASEAQKARIEARMEILRGVIGSRMPRAGGSATGGALNLGNGGAARPANGRPAPAATATPQPITRRYDSNGNLVQ